MYPDCGEKRRSTLLISCFKIHSIPAMVEHSEWITLGKFASIYTFRGLYGGPYIMTSSNGNIFRVTGTLWGKPSWSPVDSSHKGQWCGALMFSLICAWTSGWANNRYAGDLRRHRTHYDVTLMYTHYKVCAEISESFPKVFHSHFSGHLITYPCWDQS